MRQCGDRRARKRSSISRTFARRPSASNRADDQQARQELEPCLTTWIWIARSTSSGHFPTSRGSPISLRDQHHVTERAPVWWKAPASARNDCACHRRDPIRRACARATSRPCFRRRNPSGADSAPDRPKVAGAAWLDREREIADLLDRRERMALSPDDAAEIDQALERATLTLGRPRCPALEASGDRRGHERLSFIERSVLPGLPRLYAALEDRLQRSASSTLRRPS